MMARSSHLFLTGTPGVGKSTLVQDVHRRLGHVVSAIGFWTKEQCDESGKRSGFVSVDVADPLHSSQLASRVDGAADTSSDDLRIGEFRVHLDEIVKFARIALARALPQPADSAVAVSLSKPLLIFLDEVGAMQLLSSEFEDMLDALVAGSGHCCFGTIPPLGLHELPFVERLRGRADVTVIEVTEANRDVLVNEICSRLLGMLFAPDLAARIEAKALLAQRYVSELPVRLSCIEHDRAWVFKGDHGSYNVWRTVTGACRECSCPFFAETGTCSHLMAMAMMEEQSR